jgi:hypothetical protein
MLLAHPKGFEPLASAFGGLNRIDERLPISPSGEIIHLPLFAAGPIAKIVKFQCNSPP